ncbi:MAG: Nif3-like dinuclear metal center hexameric protein [Acidobacteriota bacterium]|nr:Nif3-like dinuclear metal center hexameric protein [Acidobacteriota bacterium]
MTRPQPPSSNQTPVPLADLVTYLDTYLESSAFQDYGPNGLQVEGRTPIKKIATGVSACAELFEVAAARGMDAVLVHHGLFWEKQPSPLTGVLYRRVAQLIESRLSLIAYHLPLDAHLEVGNNILAAKALGLEGLERFGVAGDAPIGFRGVFETSLDTEELSRRCRRVFAQEPLLLGRRPADGLVTAAVVSGAAQSLLHEAIGAGIDIFITGEASEWVSNLANEAGVCFVAAGHYATECLGIRALGEHVRDRFGIEADFVDVPNPV